MVTAGIIAEYNPFHQGHKYHIEKTRKQTGADYIIVVMSGDFVQRGEPAIVDKYLRTRMALAGGADLVLELPVIYASSSAEYFASAGVRLLHHLHCVDYLSFGSEWAEQKDFVLLVKILTQEPLKYKEKLKKWLKAGKNFPVARTKALEDFLEENGCATENTIKMLREPNHILGLEYMKSLDRLGSKIRPVTIRRAGAGYHDEDLQKYYPSASAIRKNLLSEMVDSVRIRQSLGSMPEEFWREFSVNHYVQWKDLMPYLDYQILMQQKNISKYFGMDVDMAARLCKKYQPGESFEQRMQALHTKRWTDAAWRRALLHSVLQIKKENFLEQAATIPVPYARVLGFSKRATPLLRQIRDKASIPLIQKTAQGRRFCVEQTAQILFVTDIYASDFYEQIAAKKSGRQPIPEWSRRQIIL